MSIHEALGLRIAQLADEQNLSIRKLAEKTGMPHSTINNIVENRRGNPTLLTLLAIAAGLGISVKDLFDIPELDNLTIDSFNEYRQELEAQNSKRREREKRL